MTNEPNDLTCPICGEGHLTERRALDKTVYADQESEIPLVYSVCDTCGSEQASPAQLRENKRALIRCQKRVDGLLPGEAIAQLLVDWQITQTQAAHIFGGGTVAFSKYKHDDVKQSEPMDKLLRVAAAIPAAFAWLAHRVGEPITDHDQSVRTAVIRLTPQPTVPNPDLQGTYRQIDSFQTYGRPYAQAPANADIYDSEVLQVG
jgi:HTH-type transcriptional regulator/antitoxin MqsA